MATIIQASLSVVWRTRHMEDGHHVHADVAVVRVFEKVLTKAEVNELYNSRPAGVKTRHDIV